jgi:hypothetical protein
MSLKDPGAGSAWRAMPNTKTRSQGMKGIWQWYSQRPTVKMVMDERFAAIAGVLRKRLEPLVVH